MPNNTYKTLLQILIGSGMIFLGFYAAFYLQIKNNLQWIFTIILSAMGFACMSVFFNGRVSIVYKYIKGTGGFAIFIFIIAVILNRFSPPSEDFSLKIQFKDSEGTSVLENTQKALKISLLKDTKTYDVNGDGEVLINIPSTTDSINIELLDIEWQFQDNKKKSLQSNIGQNGVLRLIVEPDESRCCITGKVSFNDKKQKNLANIIVKAEGQSTLTDILGYYQIKLTNSQRLKKMITITAYNKEYVGNVNCNSASPCDIKLYKK